MKGCHPDVACLWSLLLFIVVEAVPSTTRYVRETKLSSPAVCTYQNVVYNPGQNITMSNPCEMCTCDPPKFKCSLKECEVKLGCKAVHPAGHCCAKYVCDCQKNGRTYANGEKVEEPNPCNVCYCKGGEIKCVGVTCYTRNDCEPHYVAGKCCPKYDHCPPLEKNGSYVFDEEIEAQLSNLNQSVLEMLFDKWTTESTLEPFEMIVNQSISEIPVFESTIRTSTATSIATTTEEEEPIKNFSEITIFPSDTTTEEIITTTQQSEVNLTVTTPSESIVLITEGNLKPNLTFAEMFLSWLRSGSFQNAPKSINETLLNTAALSIQNNTEVESISSQRIGLLNFLKALSSELFKIIKDMPGANTITASTNKEPTMTTTMAPLENLPVGIPPNMSLLLNDESIAPVLSMISDQLQFLKIGEEQPIYIESKPVESEKKHKGEIVVPTSPPITVEMVKVVGDPQAPG